MYQQKREKIDSFEYLDSRVLHIKKQGTIKRENI
jgi:hypothetical protein